MPEIRALILTSSRARDDASADEFSDWDVVLAVTDPAAFVEGDLAWQSAFGTRLLGWGDEDEILGHPTWFRGIVYDDHSRIDFSLWPVRLLDAIGEAGILPPSLDDGYEVIVDKDRRTRSWPAPTRSAYVLRPPSEAEYRALIEEFWWNLSYLPKAIRRGDLFFLDSWMIEHDTKIVCLRRMLEWRIGAEHGWTWAPAPYGRGIERFLDPATREALAETYAGLDPDALWDVAFRISDLFRRAATDVAAALGYRYPAGIDAAMTAHLREARSRER